MLPNPPAPHWPNLPPRLRPDGLASPHRAPYLRGMKYLHTMLRVSDPDATIRFFETVGLKETRRFDNEKGRFTLIFMAAPGDEKAEVELTHNWDPEEYQGGRNFGHLAYRVDNIYETCQRLMDAGVTINRPPRDGHMAFVRSPDGISVELLQDGHLEPAEPWASMPNTGSW
jgi:lactoylglutathione lyase